MLVVLCFVFDFDGRILSVLIYVANFIFNIVNIYVFNIVFDRKIFFERFYDYFFFRGVLIIGGDFNCVDNLIDKFYLDDVYFMDKIFFYFLKLVFFLVDVWRKYYLCAIFFIWSNSNKI